MLKGKLLKKKIKTSFASKMNRTNLKDLTDAIQKYEVFLHN